MADVTFQADYRGIGQLMVAPEMQAALTSAAEAAIPFARAISPDAPPLTVGYVDSFEVDGGHVENITKRPGRRAVAYLANTSEHATAVELGWDLEHRQWTDQSGYHILSLVADHISGLI